MRLLFDQNISPRILKHFEDKLHVVRHVRFEDLEDVPDQLIFDFARDNKFSIVTLDSDFSTLNEIFGCPPKIIWLRTGNRSTLSTVSLLRANWKTIEAFLNSEKEILEIRL